MAQARVSDFFRGKKRSEAANPSKRRKLEQPETTITPQTTLQETENAEKVDPGSEKAAVTRELSSVSLLPAQSESETKTKRKSKSSIRVSSCRSKKTATKNCHQTRQQTIQNAFAKSTGQLDDVNEAASTTEITEPEALEEVTSQWDEHCTKTPKRKTRPNEKALQQNLPCDDVPLRGKLIAKKTRIETTPLKEVEDAKEKEKERRRSKLADSFHERWTANIGREEQNTSTNLVEDADTEPASSKDLPQTASSNVNLSSENQPQTQELQDMALTFIPKFSRPVSPLPATPEKLPCKSVKPVTPVKRSVTMEKCKQLQAGLMQEPGGSNAIGESSPKRKVIAPNVIRERLSKCGKLDTLKAKLAEMNSSLKAVQKIEAEKNQADVKAEVEEETWPKSPRKTPPVSPLKEPKSISAPAFERFEHLARSGPPTLALPGKYERLLSMFQGTETVVSMLHNRQETITFSKLKAAVQSLTRKNFAEKTLGQMKTVYPSAYTFRQEKGLGVFGNKVSGYQLTVEPNLEGLVKPEAETLGEKSGQPNMTGRHLLTRKKIFHDTLINITKDHHYDFLAELTPSIEVPHEKITRWHPRFKLDSVPDIQPSDLPAPPVKAYQTARQVLEATKGNLPTRVQEAMLNVSVKSEKTEPKAGPSIVQPKSSPAKPLSSAFKGIPLDFLQKIQAKEAAKAQAAMMRDPKEDKKIAMMGKLPHLIRSLRTFFVTEKKPSLPMTMVVEKLSESHGLSQVEVDRHLCLLQELAPKWMQVIQITRGKFVKIDKNADISKIIDHIGNLAKTRK